MASNNPEHPDPTLDSNYLSKAKVICDDMIYYCFDVLHSMLHRKDEPQRPSFTNKEFPLFVTWYKGKDLDLRGCIGTFSPLSLHDGLKEYALTSALRDTRFNPIHKVRSFYTTLIVLMKKDHPLPRTIQYIS
jgi:AMMECR1 domain-containing protein